MHDVALALVDVQMPGMDGFELAELMRGTEKTRRIPIIFVTAGAHDKQRIFQGYETGAVDFLFKPIDPHILRSKASVFFELHRQQQEVNRLLEESRRTADALRQSEARAKRISDAGVIGLKYWDDSGTVLDANDAFLNMVGYSRDDLTQGRINVENLTPEHYRTHDLRARQQLKEKGVATAYEKQYRRKDGSFIDVLVGGAAFEGDERRGVTMALDISARKRAENALRHSEQQFRSMANTMPQLTWAARPDGYHDFFNVRWFEYTGLSLEESVGDGWQRAFVAEDVAKALPLWQHCLKTGEPY